MCNILKITDSRVEPMKLWDSQSKEMHVYGTFHLVHFAKLFDLFNVRCSDFQKVTAPSGFIRFQPNCMESMVLGGEYRGFTFLDICQIKKKWQFDFFVNTGPYGAKNFNRYSYVFHLTQAKVDSLSLVFGHSVPFAKFPMLKIFKRLFAPTVFIQFPPNFMERMVSDGSTTIIFGLSAKV